jgi:acyl-CoA thioester hydrolase
VTQFPASGAIVGGVHRMPLMVQFEDTDMTGVVHHPNYLRFMERARSDMLRLAGIDYADLFRSGDGYWAVADARIQYRRPARFGDAIAVESRVVEVRAAATRIAQRVTAADGVLTDGEVLVAWLAVDGRPQRQPRNWITIFRRLMDEARTIHA